MAQNRLRVVGHLPRPVGIMKQYLWDILCPTTILPDFDVVRQQPAVDGLGCVCHEGASFEAGLLQEPGQSATVVQVEAAGGGDEIVVGQCQKQFFFYYLDLVGASRDDE